MATRRGSNPNLAVRSWYTGPSDGSTKLPVELPTSGAGQAMLHSRSDCGVSAVKSFNRVASLSDQSVIEFNVESK